MFPDGPAAIVNNVSHIQVVGTTCFVYSTWPSLPQSEMRDHACRPRLSRRNLKWCNVNLKRLLPL